MTRHPNLKSRKKLKPSKIQASDMMNEQETDNLSSTELDWVKKMMMCPEYHPSEVEFQDPFAYLQKIAPEASKYGICKVVSPLDPYVPAGKVLTKEKKIYKFSTQLQPLRLANWDSVDRIIFYSGGRKYTLNGFEKMARREAARKFSISGCLPASQMEKEFWEEITNNGNTRMVVYGVNIDGSAFSSSVHDPLGASNWNLNKLKQLPRSVFRLLENKIPGLTDPMLYIGMLFSMFAWHVEDHYLYSVNYHHCGAPKTWYGVPGDAALAFENIAQKHVYKPDILSRDGEDGAFEILAEKTTMFSPGILLQHDVPVFKAVQMPGEFVITFPKAYHAGFSHGFNCGEAVNVATRDWIPFGAAACHRYSLLKKIPIVPYEELLCKEAMILAEFLNHESTTSSADCLVSSEVNNCVKSSFAFLLRFYHCACWCLKKLKPSLRIFPKSQELVLCTLCKRECYVAHIVCKCSTGPMCLFHDNEIYNCKCESDDALYLREDMSKLVVTARKFEVEDDAIHREVEQQMKSDAHSWLQTIVSLTTHKYVPYSEVYHIEIEKKKENGLLVFPTGKIKN